MYMKNRDLIIGNIEEAIEQLQDAVSELRNDQEYDEGQLRLDLEHAYHHLNYAWHIRTASEPEAAECSQENYVKWSKFPVGEILEYE
jgi:TolA-binding protein